MSGAAIEATSNPLGPFKLRPVPPAVTGPPETTNPQPQQPQGSGRTE